jgi:formylglycine-generating enzyme required for sulfatase activity
MVVVPAGSFTMGSPESEPERSPAENPQLKVTIAHPFAVGKFAVTRGEFEAFVKATRHPLGDACDTWSGTEWNSVQGKSFRDPGFSQDDKHPVVCVNWYDAKAYAAWLSKTTGKDYWLLSEAQREYMTRAGTTTPFWWGSSITPAQANYNGNGVYKGGGSIGEFRGRTLPVDSFEPNPWGLYNVHGNVSDWTEDCWNDSNSGNPGDGTARTQTGACDHRVVRGGSWNLSPRFLRSAARYGGPPDNRNFNFGFRVGRTLTP